MKGKCMILSLVLIFVMACSDERIVVPKPRQYPKIVFPEKRYKDFDTDYCPLSFSFPEYGNIEKTSSFFEENPPHPCWFNVEYPEFNGRLHCSYYPIGEGKEFDDLIRDAFQFVGKHDMKANYRQESSIRSDAGIGGILFEIDGPVATPVQFFLTDSTQHFFRASLYFSNKVNPDSMAPVHAFIKEDILEMIKSFRFE